MSCHWSMYQIVFKLQSPLHSGWRRVGNIQRTRTYVTGRVFISALRTRMIQAEQVFSTPVEDGQDRESWKWLHENIANTYFYPALKNTESENQYDFLLPHEEETFKHCLISSYTGTALNYSQQAAEEATLHEVEFISPKLLHDFKTHKAGENIYLVGYLFERCDKKHELITKCLSKIRFGGERNYGWGQVKLENLTEIDKQEIFGLYEVILDESHPTITITTENSHILAHVKADELQIQGEIEPLLGRSWIWSRIGKDAERHGQGQHIIFNDICFMPGAKLTTETQFKIGKSGIWEKKPSP